MSHLHEVGHIEFFFDTENFMIEELSINLMVDQSQGRPLSEGCPWRKCFFFFFCLQEQNILFLLDTWHIKSALKERQNRTRVIG